MLYGDENHGYKNAMQRVAGKKIKGRGGRNQKRLNYIPPWHFVLRKFKVIIISLLHRPSHALLAFCLCWILSLLFLSLFFFPHRWSSPLKSFVCLCQMLSRGSMISSFSLSHPSQVWSRPISLPPLPDAVSFVAGENFGTRPSLA